VREKRHGESGLDCSLLKRRGEASRHGRRLWKNNRGPRAPLVGGPDGKRGGHVGPGPSRPARCGGGGWTGCWVGGGARIARGVRV
jgi:hypothetical protein